MEQNLDQKLDENKVNVIKYRILEMETDNVVKKESNPAMEDKIKKMIITEVDKR
ncbi:MAG: hypothetical protein MJZ34_12870 [Paludibacteraceae bacterium]|nr:hypothetical protein [Paludibacteraceae bacterium]